MNTFVIDTRSADPLFGPPPGLLAASPEDYETWLLESYWNGEHSWRRDENTVVKESLGGINQRLNAMFYEARHFGAKILAIGPFARQVANVVREIATDVAVEVVE